MTKRPITPPIGKYVTITDDGDVHDVLDTMVQCIIEASDTSLIKFIADELTAVSRDEDDLLRNMAILLFKRAYFKPHPNKSQDIRTPARLFRDGRANCVDYSVTLGAIAHCIGLPVTLRAVQLPGQKTYGHIYPIINGVVVDIVPGQDQSGNEYLTRKPGMIPAIGKELQYLNFLDTPILDNGF